VKALDLFSGARGWGIAARELGWDEDGVEIMPEARATAAAAGFRHVGHDVREVRTEPGEYDTHIGSPSCKRYSAAGNGAGRRALDDVLAGVKAIGAGETFDSAHIDPDTALTLQPLRIALDGMPRVIAWEQVPAVLPVWQACAVVLRERGYSVTTSVLNAEQYGVPQTRRRAFLVARRDGVPAALPTPTHSRYHSHAPARLDDGVKPWVSMADALRWDPDTYVISNYGTGGDPRNRRRRTAPEPAATITGKANRAKIVQAGKRMGAGMEAAYGSRPGRPADHPAFTVRANAGGMEPGGFRWELDDATTRKMTPEEAATLQTFPNGYSFQGGKSRVMEQIGNAVPPLLAHAVLRELLP
jgi:DNA (cytosine-5)-methyltransferase 1